MSNEPRATDSPLAGLAFRQAQHTLRAFYRIGREATELGCRFDLMPGSPIVAEALKSVLEREAEKAYWKDTEGVTFTPADIALSLIDISLYGQNIAQDAISGDLSFSSLITDYQWGIVCGMVIAGGYLDQAYEDGPAVRADKSETVLQRRCRHPSWWHDTEVREFVISMYRQATLNQILDMARQKFGEDRTPSRSSLNRYWLRLDSKAGLSPERAKEIRRRVLGLPK